MTDGHTRVDPCTGTTGTRDILCPFFIAHGMREVHCEAYDDRAKNIMRFRCPENKREHMVTYCRDRYTFCEHYRGLMRDKYDEEE